MSSLTLDDLVRNRTMSAEMAAVLSAAAAERRSFLVVAQPRLAGKTTTMEAMLQHAPPGTPVHVLARSAGPDLGIPEVADGGYLRLAEVAETGFDDYFWGAEVCRVFDALDRGFSLATALHADSLAGAFEVLAANGVSAAGMAHLQLVAVIRILGDWQAPDRRALAELHEVEPAAEGGVTSRLLHRWDPATDRFEQVGAPANIGSVVRDIDARAVGFRQRSGA
ncbi:MAG: hypothetical protein WD058_09385 [Dehalococcoidia bacterium]